jgi:hypothetical protein
MPAKWFILARAVHFGACLLFFGLWAFDRIVFPALGRGGDPILRDFWQAHLRRFSLVLLPVILLSGIAWFLFVAWTMGGEPLRWGILKTVWSQTLFGSVWRCRLGLWCVAVIAAGAALFFPAKMKEWSYLQLLLSGSLVGWLAWAGHGQENSPWHLAADVLHLLVADRLMAIVDAVEISAANAGAARAGVDRPPRASFFRDQPGECGAAGADGVRQRDVPGGFTH